MDEREWLASDDPAAMLATITEPSHHLPTKHGVNRISDRKLRLFAVACCYQVWPLLTDERSRRAVEVASRFADGEVEDAQRQRAAFDGYENPPIATAFACYVDVMDGISELRSLPGSSPAAQADLLREIVGNPFRPVTLPLDWICTNCEGDGGYSVDTGGTEPWGDPVDAWYVCDSCGGQGRRCPWLTPQVLSLANAAYAGDWGVLPVLADALEEVGCDSADLLDHLRSPGPHVRGCWAVDCLLGKA